MNLVAHRGLWKHPREANSLPALISALKSGLGVETDLRSVGEKIYLSHDPIEDASDLPTLESLLEAAPLHTRGPLFLNIKEDGLARRLLPYRERLSKLRAVFFDMSTPELVHYARVFPPSMLSARISDIEPYPSGIHFCGWLWIDCFYRELTWHEIGEVYRRFQVRCAFVSPELHGRPEKGLWSLVAELSLAEGERTFLCTDRCPEWDGSIRNRKTR